MNQCISIHHPRRHARGQLIVELLDRIHGSGWHLDRLAASFGTGANRIGQAARSTRPRWVHKERHHRGWRWKRHPVQPVVVTSDRLLIHTQRLLGWSYTARLRQELLRLRLVSAQVLLAAGRLQTILGARPIWSERHESGIWVQHEGLHLLFTTIQRSSFDRGPGSHLRHAVRSLHHSPNANHHKSYPTPKYTPPLSVSTHTGTDTENGCSWTHAHSALPRAARRSDGVWQRTDASSRRQSTTSSTSTPLSRVPKVAGLSCPNKPAPILPRKGRAHIVQSIATLPSLPSNATGERTVVCQPEVGSQHAA
jgi:hypothetical protein